MHDVPTHPEPTATTWPRHAFMHPVLACTSSLQLIFTDRLLWCTCSLTTLSTSTSLERGTLPHGQRPCSLQPAKALAVQAGISADCGAGALAIQAGISAAFTGRDTTFLKKMIHRFPQWPDPNLLLEEVPLRPVGGDDADLNIWRLRFRLGLCSVGCPCICHLAPVCCATRTVCVSVCASLYVYEYSWARVYCLCQSCSASCTWPGFFLELSTLPPA